MKTADSDTRSRVSSAAFCALTLFPEYNIWFFGDCGQGDLIAALDSIKNKWIERAFMHQINSKNCVFPQGFDDAKARVTEFKDYNELQDKLNDERIEGIKF